MDSGVGYLHVTDASDEEGADSVHVTAAIPAVNK
jgi:hypothetical protein